MEEIRFYKVDDLYGFFSNFSGYRIFIDNEVWPTVEHYFQANKFENLELRLKIKNIDSPMKAAQEGRNKNYILRPDWERVKEDIMMKALLAKFLQHQDLKLNLLNTNNAIIIEDTKNDNYWGNGGDGSGKNRLGILLMETRGIINRMYNDINAVFPPWVVFPGVSQHDLFWRMGIGEDFLYKWSQYYFNIHDKEHYKSAFPPNNDWYDIYD